MKIAALCPTYKRPDMLANAAALFHDQQVDAETRLFVLDDVAQHHAGAHVGPWLQVEQTYTRYHNLPAKFNRLARLAHEWGADVLVVWEDDDIYLPHHLADIKEAVEGGARYVAHQRVWSTYGQPFGHAQLEPASTRFHASWAFTLDLLHEVGGWPCTSRLDFDQQFGGLLRTAAGSEAVVLDKENPGYVYRWGNGIYHGSQFGEGNWYDRVGDMPLSDKWVGYIKPKLDDQTMKLLEGLCQYQPSA